MMAKTNTIDSNTHKRKFSWLRRFALGLLITLIVLVTAGFIFERLAQANDSRRYPAPGQMIDVGEHQLHFYVTGEATDQPTIVLEAGNGGFSSQWVWLQEELSKQTLVVSYDRAGLGWSESDSQPRDLLRNNEQLRTGLRMLNIEPPYILVGHSLGGLFILAYQEQYPDEVAGLVFLDSSHPDQLNRMPPELVQAQERAETTGNILSVIAHFGVIRLLQPNAPFVATLPERQKSESLALSSTSRYIKTSFGELAIFDSAQEQLGDLSHIEDVKIISLTAGEQLNNPDLPASFGEVLIELHTELASLSINGEHRIIEGADHYTILMEETYALQAAGAVRDVVDAVRYESAD